MKKPLKIVLIVVIILCLAVFCFCGYKAYLIYHQYKTDQDIYSQISSSFVSERTPDQNSSVSHEHRGGFIEIEVDDPTDPEGPKITKTVLDEDPPVEVDFEYTKRELSDEVVAWLECPDTVINYPVLQHNDNEFYLNHNAYGDETPCGALFLSAANFNTFTDSNSIIHGHHLNDGSMFGSLGNWGNQSYFDEHRYFYLMSPKGNFKVTMIAYLVTPSGSDAYRIEFKGDDDMEDWVDWLKSESMVKCDYTYEPGTCFLSLSTCMYSFDGARGVLIGFLTPILE